ncbi:MAG: MFS transporter [Promethearchaeota archaeon]
MRLDLRRVKREYIPDSHKFTSDFNSVIFIVVWNSLGFFFVDFIMTYIISQVLGGSGVAIGLFPAFLTIGGLISSSFIGYLTDRYSKKILVMIGAFVRGLSYFGLYTSILIQSLVGMYCSAFLLGFGAYIFWNPLDTIISEKSSKYHRSSAFGKRRFALGIGMVLGTIVGFTIFSLTNIFMPDNAFLIFSAIPIFGMANFYAGIQFSRKVDENKKFQYPNNSIEGTIEKLESEFNDIKNPEKTVHFYLLGIILLFLALFLGATNAGVYRPFILPLIFLNISSNPSLVSWFFLPTSIIGTIIAPKLGTIADKINPYLGLSIASTIGGFVTFLIIICKDLWFFAFLLIIDNTIMLTTGFIMINFISRVSIKHRGKLFGLISAFESTGMIIGPFLGGIVWDTVSPQTPFIISIIVEWSLIPFFLLGIYILNPYIMETIDKIKGK